MLRFLKWLVVSPGLHEQSGIPFRLLLVRSAFLVPMCACFTISAETISIGPLLVLDIEPSGAILAVLFGVVAAMLITMFQGIIQYESSSEKY